MIAPGYVSVPISQSQSSLVSDLLKGRGITLPIHIIVDPNTIDFLRPNRSDTNDMNGIDVMAPRL